MMISTMELITPLDSDGCAYNFEFKHNNLPVYRIGCLWSLTHSHITSKVSMETALLYKCIYMYICIYVCMYVCILSKVRCEPYKMFDLHV